MLRSQMSALTSTKKRPIADDPAFAGQDNLPSKRQQITTTTGNSDNVSIAGRNLRPSQLQSSSEIIDLTGPSTVKSVFAGGEDKFSRFNGGLVYIELATLSKEYSYAFERTVLAGASSWFAETMRRPVYETNSQKAERFKRKCGYRFRFELSYSEDDGIWVLNRVPFTLPRKPNPVVQTTDTDQSVCPEDFQPSRAPSAIDSATSESLASSSTEVSDATPTHSLPPSKTAQDNITSENTLTLLPTGGQNPRDDQRVVETECDIAETRIEESKRQQDAAENDRASHSTDGISSTTQAAEPDIEASEDREVPLEVCEAYNNLFLLMHGMTANLDNYNVDTVLVQIEQIIDIAIYYRCLELVRCPSLGHHLLEFGLDLFEAVMLDPARWLKLSIHLEVALIFKEALVHIVGQFRYYPWKTPPPPEIPSHIWDIVREKSENVQGLKAVVDQELFTDSTNICGRSLTFKDATFRTWVIVNYWHEWVSLAVKQTSDLYPKICTCWGMYRLIENGGDAYLPAASVCEDLKRHGVDGIEDWDVNEVENVLDMLKDFAKEVVGKLCVNHSILDVEAFGIEYLTCCEVANSDLPWLQDEA